MNVLSTLLISLSCAVVIVVGNRVVEKLIQEITD